MPPLGPLNGKSFGTTISPWIVTIDALTPFEIVPSNRSKLEEPSQTAPYLVDPKKKNHYAIQLQADIVPSKSMTRTTVCKSRFEWMYYTPRDLIAHQTVNGCPVNSGDLLGTGTISGSERGSYGCLLEITRGGKEEILLDGVANGDEEVEERKRVYLKDGDGVVLTGWAGELGSEDCVGFGACEGVVVD